MTNVNSYHMNTYIDELFFIEVTIEDHCYFRILYIDL